MGEIYSFALRDGGKAEAEVSLVANFDSERKARVDFCLSGETVCDFDLESVFNISTNLNFRETFLKKVLKQLKA